ncbi:hypothetical protein P154DRAFT_446637 [Amniculicola lignicola CBS 123094]|uniref:DUF7924 domain-containing protein n=1 Tax=Amniculicola lignicola CBS 123094 TaxID=1392246 RepID=A0A6A5W748_9PLEO|nr:hypothetical protein P154DRAFT_446637 [Amniculicola lignicola CBS 123094]
MQNNYAANSSFRSVSEFDSQSSKSSKRTVEDPFYRTLYCQPNGIFLNKPNTQPPSPVRYIISGLDKERKSPQPDFNNDEELESIEEAPEAAVERYFNTKVFPPTLPTLRRDDRAPMTAQVPSLPAATTKISRPQPDALYGYTNSTFDQDGRYLFTTRDAYANSTNLLYPFFVIEYKGDGGSMMVATNQCLGGASTCVSIAENLKQRLQTAGLDEITPLDTCSFSIAVNGSEARLLVTWKASHEAYYTKRCGSYTMRKPEDIQKFRTVCRNVLDWGRTERLQQIYSAIDALAEHSRQIQSAKSKSRLQTTSEEIPPSKRRVTRAKPPAPSYAATRVGPPAYTANSSHLPNQVPALIPPPSYGEYSSPYPPTHHSSESFRSIPKTDVSNIQALPSPHSSAPSRKLFYDTEHQSWYYVDAMGNSIWAKHGA